MSILSKYDVIVVGNGVLANLLIFYSKVSKRSCFQLIGESDYKFVSIYPNKKYANLFENGNYGAPKNIGNRNLWGGMLSLPKYENYKIDRLNNGNLITTKRYYKIKKIIESIFGVYLNKKVFDGVYLSKWLSPFYRIAFGFIKPTMSIVFDYDTNISIKEVNGWSYLEYIYNGKNRTVYSKKIIVCAGFFNTSMLKQSFNESGQKSELNGTFGDHVSFFFNDPMKSYSLLNLENKWVSNCCVYSLKKEIITNVGVSYLHVEPAHENNLEIKNGKSLERSSIINLLCQGTGVKKFLRAMRIGLFSLFHKINLKTDNYYLVIDVPIKKLWKFSLNNSIIELTLCEDEIERNKRVIQSKLRKEYDHIVGVNWESPSRIRVALHPYALKIEQSNLTFLKGYRRENTSNSDSVLWLASDNIDSETADGHVGTLLLAGIDFITRR